MRARHGLAVLGALLALASAQRANADEPPAKQANAERPRAPEGSSRYGKRREPKRGWFSGELAAAYAAPFVFAGAAFAVEDASLATGQVLGAMSLASLAAPPAIRIAHGDGWGALIGFGGTVGSTAGGLVLGTVIGAGTCDESTDSDCIARPIGFGLLGGLLGYVTWAVVDSLAFAYTTPDEPSKPVDDVATVAPFLAPLVSPPTAVGEPRASGLMLGASGRF